MLLHGVRRGQSTFLAPQYQLRSSVVESHVPQSVRFGEGGERTGNGFRRPPQSCAGIRLQARRWGWGGGYPSGAAGTAGLARPSPYLVCSLVLELLATNLEMMPGRLQRLPPGSADPQRSLLAGAGEQTRFYRGDEMQICASHSPPFLQFPQKKKNNG